MKPDEAYQLSVEGGIKYFRRLIEDAAAAGLVKANIPVCSKWIAPEVIEHYRELGYEFDSNLNWMTWKNAKYSKPGFNQ